MPPQPWKRLWRSHIEGVHQGTFRFSWRNISFREAGTFRFADYTRAPVPGKPKRTACDKLKNAIRDIMG